ncbi:MAG: SH3 domain-containing protein, partial [Leptospiraceae bacterium]|nr:SH3 domain-containing protein [Leptospiraceae bacterium]
MRRHFQIFLVHCFIIFLCLSIGFLTEPALSEANRETSDSAVTASASLMVTADVLRVRSSPTTESDTLSRLPGGTRVTPLERQLVRNGIESDFGAWFRIEYAEGKEGWVHGNFLRLESGFPENTEYTVFYPFFNHWMISQDVSTIHENIIGLYFIGGYLNGENLLLREKINDLAIDQISEYRERRRLYLERFLRSGLETVILSQNANRIGVARPYEIQIDDGVPSFFGIRAQREM